MNLHPMNAAAAQADDTLTDAQIGELMERERTDDMPSISAETLVWLGWDKPRGPKCGCRNCLHEFDPALLMTTFVVCPECGDKRCPRADDHRNDCAGEPALTPSEAVFAFAALLTCRKDAVTLGSRHDAAPAAELAGAFTQSQGMKPPREDFHTRIRQRAEDAREYCEVQPLYVAPQPPAQAERKPLTDEQIARAMLSVNDPVAWGRLGDLQKPMLKRFAKAIADQVAQPAGTLTAERIEYVKAIVAKLEAWRPCMSYNDSYFGEPAGLVKSVVRELSKALNVIPPPLVAAPKSPTGMITAEAHERMVHEAVKQAYERAAAACEEQAIIGLIAASHSDREAYALALCHAEDAIRALAQQEASS